MKIIRKAGDTSNILQVFIQDSSSTTGAGLTGLVFNSGSLTAYYHKDTDTTATAISLVTMTVGTFTSSGFKEIDATNMPGWYQFCPPDAALSTSGTPKSVGFHLRGATNMAPLAIEVQLVTFDLQTAALTAAAIATGVWQDATGGDFTVSSSIGKSLYTTGNAPGAASGLALVGSNMGTISGALTGAQIATAVWTDTTAGDFTTSLSIGKSVMNGVTLGTGLTVAAVSGAVGSVTGAVGSVTGAVGSVTGAVGSVASAGITRASFSADTGLQSVRSNTAQAGASTTITLDASASATNSFYNNCLCYLTGGTGVGQARFVTGYVGSTKIATVNSAWATNPDSSTTFAIMEFDAVPGASAPTAAQVATAVWQDATAGDFTVSSSIGKSLYTTGNAPGAASGLALVGSNMGTITGALTAAQIATGVWTDTTAGDFTTALSVGKSVMNGVALGTGLTVNDLTTKTGYSLASSQTFNNTGTWTGNIVGTLSTLTTYTGNTVQTGDAYARLGAPTGASTSADIAAVKTDTAAVKVQTDKLTFTVANKVDANALAVSGNATAASNVAHSMQAITRGTCSGGTTTTAIVSTLTSPGSLGASGQLIGRTILFDADTTTTNLQGQASNITANTTGATPTLTFTAMTTAPANGDTFSVL